jgi:hypothetical protein
MRSRPSPLSLVPLLLALAAPCARAWDYEGHRIVNQLALASLPKEFPAFVHAVANEERVAFLAGEPDRWRNVPDLPFKHAASVEHYCDMEYITDAGLEWAAVPSFRLDFIVQFAAARAAHAKNFLPFDPAKNTDHTREWPGFAPWAVAENFAKLRSAFSYLKVFEELGTPDEIMNAQANVLYVMGTMGHYVGDCAQPLHTTKHHNGWVGENPQGYSTWPGLHSWVDGGIIAKAGIRSAQIAPRVKTAEVIPLAARPDGRDPLFVAAVEYLLRQNQQVEPLYRLEKAGKLGHGEQPMTDEARTFIEARLLEGGQMLGDIWLTAYKAAVPDTYLRSALIKRATASGATPTGAGEKPAEKKTAL